MYELDSLNSLLAATDSFKVHFTYVKREGFKV